MLANFFFPGVGQLMQGRYLAAFMWLVFFVFALFSVLFYVGLVLVPAVWVAAIVDAASYRPPRPESSASAP